MEGSGLSAAMDFNEGRVPQGLQNLLGVVDAGLFGPSFNPCGCAVPVWQSLLYRATNVAQGTLDVELTLDGLWGAQDLLDVANRSVSALMTGGALSRATEPEASATDLIFQGTVAPGFVVDAAVRITCLSFFGHFF